ncbi:MAG: GNAT family N-acetyltransferase [Kiloniellales bacterium]|nr:GNAT family N-acetyltransferase [Kiloniellales bacterium]
MEIHPVTADRWPDREALFGPRGASGGCWCMLWRCARKDWEAGKGDGNRAALKALTESAEPPGLLAYEAGEAVGWCSLGPRTAFPGLARSRILQPVDDLPVWSVTCFFLRKDQRRRGLSARLLGAAADYAKNQGAPAVEGYPVEPNKPNYPAVYAWTGLASAFRRAGYQEVARRSETRPIMRKLLDG